MRSASFLEHIGAALLCAGFASAASYTLADNYDHTNFFSEWDFFSGPDPTSGFVKYETQQAANSSGLAGYKNGSVYLGVDHTTMNPSGGRNSVRVSSNKAYTHGLFIADIAHMPDSTCGVWPAWWTFGPNWPSSGEIDIIEGVNTQQNDSITLHTSAGCTMQSTGAAKSSVLAQTNCNAGNGDTGCGFGTQSTTNYGSGFNAAGGGVYAMEWTSSTIQVFYFPRTSIPSDILSGKPNPAGWSTPVAAFSGSGCNIDQHFMNHNIVFDTTFCGQWAGQVWNSNPTCAKLAPSCNAYVGANPSAFTSAYWLVNSVKVYQNGTTKREVPFEA